MLIATAAGCILTACSNTVCDPERCATAPLMITVVDAVTAERLAGATVTTVPSGAMVSSGCLFSGESWNCTHEVLTIPGNEAARVRSTEVQPGHGEFHAFAELSFALVVSEDSHVERTVTVDLATTRCGNVVPLHLVIPLAQTPGDVAPAVAPAAAPAVCGD
jgi:hypothetical protein